jgi:hypothetical protein
MRMLKKNAAREEEARRSRGLLYLRLLASGEGRMQYSHVASKNPWLRSSRGYH